ncbi:MAG: hypothetical protein JW776_07835 [Candidatus Lokiarchaeota archaeon]|nr:hypothetical protein [Candidatus Lokiarchaeota archaeon]
MSENPFPPPNDSDHSDSEINPREQDKKMKPTYHYDWWGYILIGIVLSVFNVWISWYMYFCTGYESCDSCFWDPSAVQAGDSTIGIWSFFIVPFLFLIPAIIFSNMKRTRGYAYVIGYVTGGLIGIVWDPFIGIYTSSVAAILFFIVYFIFWRIWRSFTKFKT